MASGKIRVGSPKLSVDLALILRMCEEDKMGWSRLAKIYREITGQYVSHDTIKRRYCEFKYSDPVIDIMLISNREIPPKAQTSD